MAASAGSRVVSSDANLLAPSKTRTRTQNAANAGSSSVMDPSVLRPSINVSITGMRQAVQLLETGTKEVRNYLLHECNLLYECKTCQNLFRSVGNLIAHKRHYCRHRYQDVRHVYRRDPGEMGLVVGADQSEDATGATRACAASTPQTTAFVQPEAVETIVKEKDWNLSDYHPSLELLHQAGTIEEIERRPLVSRLHNQAAAPTTTTTAQRAGLASVVQRLREKADNGPEQEYYERRQREALIRLEKIQQTDRAVFQTVGPPDTTTMGQRYVELQHLRQSPCVFVGPDGRIVEPGPLPPVQPNPGSIGVNGVGGGSVGGAQSNEGYDSSKENLLYPCPLCKKEYSMLQNVLRHITRLHKKPLDEAKLLRKKSKKMAIAAHNKKKRTQQHQDLVKSFGQLATAFSCPGCYKSFTNRGNRNTHVKFCPKAASVATTTLGLGQQMAFTSRAKQPVVVLHKLDGRMLQQALKSYTKRNGDWTKRDASEPEDIVNESSKMSSILNECSAKVRDEINVENIAAGGDKVGGVSDCETSSEQGLAPANRKRVRCSSASSEPGDLKKIRIVVGDGQDLRRLDSKLDLSGKNEPKVVLEPILVNGSDGKAGQQAMLAATNKAASTNGVTPAAASTTTTTPPTSSPGKRTGRKQPKQNIVKVQYPTAEPELSAETPKPPPSGKEEPASEKVACSTLAKEDASAKEAGPASKKDEAEATATGTSEAEAEATATGTSEAEAEAEAEVTVKRSRGRPKGKKGQPNSDDSNDSEITFKGSKTAAATPASSTPTPTPTPEKRLSMRGARNGSSKEAAGK